MNPKTLLNMMLQRNPMLKNNPVIMNALQMAKTGNANGLKMLAENIAKEKGIDISQIRKQLGI